MDFVMNFVMDFWENNLQILKIEFNSILSGLQITKFFYLFPTLLFKDYIEYMKNSRH